MTTTLPESLAARPHAFEPGDGSPAPPLLVLHGTGGDEYDLLPVARQLSPGSALFSPRGAVLENGMPRFFARFPDGSLDLEDLAVRTDELARLITMAADHYGFDPARLVALGFSNGANIAVRLLLSHPASLAGAALLRPMYQDAEPGADLAGRPVLIVSGANDPWAPPDQVERLVWLLRGGGAEVEHVAVATGHNLTQQDLTAAEDWFDGIVGRRS